MSGGWPLFHLLIDCLSVSGVFAKQIFPETPCRSPKQYLPKTQNPILMNRFSWIIVSVACCSQLLAQTTIKQYYGIFPNRLKESEAVGSMHDADTIVDDRNAYLHIRSKPNDCCSEYVTFTFFKTQSGKKIFACEKGVSTTASDDYQTTFHAFANNKWTDVTSQVFPFVFSFADFWAGTSLPPKKMQRFHTRIALPQRGTDVVVYIVGENLLDRERLFTDTKDAEMYERIFDTNRSFHKITYQWNREKSVFTRKGRQKE